MVEHASFIFELDESACRIISEINDAMFASGTTAYWHLTDTRFDANVGRVLLSGNVRAFRDAFRFIEHHNNYIPAMFGDFIHANPILFPEWQDSISNLSRE